MNRPNSPDDPVFIDDSASDMTADAPKRVPTSAGASVRPSGLSNICVLAILLSGVGLLSGCVGVISQVFASGMQQAFSRMPAGANAPGVEKQKEMNDRMFAVANRYKWATFPLMAVKIVVEAALLTGAIMSLRLNPRGRSWLRGALLAAILFEAVYAVPVILIQRESQAVMSEMMPKVLEAQQGANKQLPGMNDVMSTFFSAVGIFSMIFALGWLAAKIVFCALSLRYLRKPEIQALFEPPAAVPLM
jgi:hypothetical protein